jgi:hypothetical protein
MRYRLCKVLPHLSGGVGREYLAQGIREPDDVVRFDQKGFGAQVKRLFSELSVSAKEGHRQIICAGIILETAADFHAVHIGQIHVQIEDVAGCDFILGFADPPTFRSYGGQEG